MPHMTHVFTQVASTMFIIKCLFWLSVVVLLLPAAPGDNGSFGEISPFEALGAAATAVRDVSGFCGRNPKACETGGKAAVALGHKAKYQVQHFLNNGRAETRPAPEKTMPASQEAELIPSANNSDSSPAINLAKQALANPKLAAQIAAQVSPELANAALKTLFDQHPLPIPAPKS